MHGVTVERVKQLITDSGLGQAEFAAKVGLDGSKMSKSLAGVRRFTSLDLARIADMGATTVDWLLGADKPVPAVAARAAAQVATSQDVAIEEAGRLSQLWSDLSYLGYAQGRVSLEPVPKTGRCVDQGRKLAAVARRRAGDERVNAWEVRDLAPLVEDVFGIDVRIMSLPDGFEGLSWTDDLCGLMVVGSSELPSRQRFTIAHELGHLLAGDDQGLHLDGSLDDAAHKRKPSEMRANAFAAEFLLPGDVLTRQVRDMVWTDRSFAELACRLLVSPATLAWRLFNLDLIDRGSCAAFARMRAWDAATLAGRTDSFAEWVASASQPRVPLPLMRTMLRAYRDGQATLRPLAGLLGMDTTLLRQAMGLSREDSPLSS
ncbi:XRE family transcriptional regulator [Nonomuraea sp. NPDC049158]|uniref:helix-turn-helix domain-containing protein n=1 Tax=Nonomuraea sp. NPDC049158 TaxID=3155649 RepID=UPI0033C40767